MALLQPVRDIATNVAASLIDTANSVTTSNTMRTYAPSEYNWENGTKPNNVASGTLPRTEGVVTQVITPSSMGETEASLYVERTDQELGIEELKRLRVPDNVSKDTVLGLSSNNTWSNPNKRSELLNENKSLVQNNYSFPYYVKPSFGTDPARYDYQIIPGDPRYPKMITLEDKLKEARASFGIHVHGDNDIARAVKYNLYNRYKSPDTNLVFSKMSTHIFFTRPDLNLLNCCGGKIYGAHRQIRDHSDTSLLYKTNPYIFRLLTDGFRCGDRNNFNMLLSGQIGSFDITDEEINASEVGKSWNGHSMMYGNGYTGRGPGEISCQFAELQDLSVIKMMKLWLTYIDNVSTGAWSPSYDLLGSEVKRLNGSYSQSYAISSYPCGRSIEDSHVYTKTLDYAASVYVFKCGPTGDEVLYWSKYYGVFPINTGASALSWDGSPMGSETSKLSLRFKYCYKRDMSPISLIEFNEQSGITGSKIPVAENSFNPNFNHSSRPYVGAPFIEITRPTSDDVAVGNDSDMYGRPKTRICLKFAKNNDPRLTDETLYLSQHSNRRNVK